MATIREVARKSGVSSATVSNVLNARACKVSAATREKVLQAVRDLNYQPSPAVLRGEPHGTRNLVVLLPRDTLEPVPGVELFLSSAYLNALIDGMLEETARNGWGLTLLVQPETEGSDAWLRRVVDGRCEGVIMINPKHRSTVPSKLLERGLPVLCLGSRPCDERAPYLDVDNTEAAREVVRYLVGLGHRAIAHLGGHRATSSAEERAKGYLAEMRLRGLGTNTQIAWGDFSERSGHELAKRMLSGNTRPTALICANDPMAAGAIQAARDAGLRVPDDLSIIGFDDAPLHGRDLELTTVRQPLRRMGGKAVSLLVARAVEGTAVASSNLFHGELVLRRTTGPAPLATQAATHDLHPRIHVPTEVQ